MCFSGEHNAATNAKPLSTWMDEPPYEMTP